MESAIFNILTFQDFSERYLDVISTPTFQTGMESVCPKRLHPVACPIAATLAAQIASLSWQPSLHQMKTSSYHLHARSNARRRLFRVFIGGQHRGHAHVQRGHSADHSWRFWCVKEMYETILSMGIDVKNVCGRKRPFAQNSVQIWTRRRFLSNCVLQHSKELQSTVPVAPVHLGMCRGTPLVACEDQQTFPCALWRPI